ncbi:MAG: hydrogen peroxide-inducible genes activator [Bdellovibrionales bacterium]|nr:hydrogen peroxide-inducible genes activator [Bdellovibrionales bacterium]
MPTLTQLEYIVAVDKHKHFGRAAEECHVSQPSLSAQIQKAEEELDVIIFDRSKKPIITTELGERIVDQSRKVLFEHERLFLLSDKKSPVSGRFHLGVIPTLAPYLIPLFVKNFADKFPGVDLTISEYKTEDIVKKLLTDELDGGLLVTPLYNPAINERKLFLEPFHGFVAKEHALFKKKILNENDLDAESIWLLNEGHCFRDQVIKVCHLNREVERKKNIHFESGNLETIVNLIRQGTGYTLLPHLATSLLTAKEKTENLKHFVSPIPTREVSMVYSREFLKIKIIDALSEEILTNLPDDLKSNKKKKYEIIDI